MNGCGARDHRQTGEAEGEQGGAADGDVDGRRGLEAAPDEHPERAAR